MIPIGIGHRKRVGKDYFANLLVKELANIGVFAPIVHFADHLKRLAHHIYAPYGLQEAAVYDRFPELRSVPLPLLGKTPRELWIAIGSSLATIHGQYWVEALFRSWTAGPVVIADVRFPQEAQAIKDRGGLLVKVSSPLVSKDTDGADEVLENYTGWDVEVVNDFNDRKLQRRAEDLAQQIKDIIDGR